MMYTGPDGKPWIANEATEPQAPPSVTWQDKLMLFIAVFIAAPAIVALGAWLQGV